MILLINSSIKKISFILINRLELIFDLFEFIPFLAAKAHQNK